MSSFNLLLYLLFPPTVATGRLQDHREKLSEKLTTLSTTKAGKAFRTSMTRLPQDTERLSEDRGRPMVRLCEDTGTSITRLFEDRGRSVTKLPEDRE